MDSMKATLQGGRVQIIINGCVQFDRQVDAIDVTTILHTEDNKPPCEMQFAMKYGHRTPDGTIVDDALHQPS